MNLNEYVEVTLTAKGAEIYNARYSGVWIPEDYGVKLDYAEGSYLKVQLWSLMRVFGKHMQLGCQSPFVDNEMKICSK